MSLCAASSAEIRLVRELIWMSSGEVGCQGPQAVVEDIDLDSFDDSNFSEEELEGFDANEYVFEFPSSFIPFRRIQAAPV